MKEKLKFHKDQCIEVEFSILFSEVYSPVLASGAQGRKSLSNPCQRQNTAVEKPAKNLGIHFRRQHFWGMYQVSSIEHLYCVMDSQIRVSFHRFF